MCDDTSTSRRAGLRHGTNTHEHRFAFQFFTKAPTPGRYTTPAYADPSTLFTSHCSHTQFRTPNRATRELHSTVEAQSWKPIAASIVTRKEHSEASSSCDLADVSDDGRRHPTCPYWGSIIFRVGIEL